VLASKQNSQDFARQLVKLFKVASSGESSDGQLQHTLLFHPPRARPRSAGHTPRGKSRTADRSVTEAVGLGSEPAAEAPAPETNPLASSVVKIQAAYRGHMERKRTTLQKVNISGIPK
jgi:hypothetical protein